MVRSTIDQNEEEEDLSIYFRERRPSIRRCAEGIDRSDKRRDRRDGCSTDEVLDAWRTLLSIALDDI